MITKEALKEIIDNPPAPRRAIPRTTKIPQETNRIIIITGIRRCGKSTLLKETFKNQKNKISINFEDTRLQGFEQKDFNKINDIAEEKKTKTIIFDEIQNIPGWETYARAAHDQNKNIYITGSNASMLSRELGTKLTGRHKQIELFPFNYKEYLEYTKKQPGEKSLKEYLQEGGFPEYLEEKDPDILRRLLRDVIIRDIAVRRNIRNEQDILRLATHIISNIGKEFSYNKTTKTIGIKSVRTTIDYCDHLQESYLLQLIPRYDKSTKKQQTNPKKAYAIDTGMARQNSLSFSKDQGRMLENTIYLALRHNHQDIMYYRDEEAECDFLIRDREQITTAIQACWHLNDENMTREIKGIKQAMKKTGAKKGAIITYNQEDEIEEIPIIPAWKWLIKQAN